MKRISAFVGACFMILTIAVPVAWAGEATAEQAVALANRAIQLIEKTGAEDAFAAFNAGGAWKEGELYITVNDDSGWCLVNSNTSAMVGKNLLEMKDVKGKYLVKEMLAVKDKGWITYFWINPLTKQVAEKHVFVVRTGPYVVSVGFYE